MRFWPIISLVSTLTFAGSAPLPVPQSAAPAVKLGELLAAKNLTAVAARDSSEPGRFVAALLVPHVQLLVVSARYSQPDLLDGRLVRKEYRDAYEDIFSASIKETKVFFEDANADGLCNDRTAPDVMYEGGVKQTIFDGDWHKHGLSEKAYTDLYTKADARYAQMLSDLIAVLDPSAAGTH